MESHAKELCCLKLPINDSLAGMPREVVLMIKGGGTAVLDQFTDGGDRGVIETVFVKARKEWVDSI